MKVAKVRDLLAFLLFFALLILLGENQFSSGDEQWLAGTERLTPIFVLAVLSLCGTFYFRSTAFNIKSKVGPLFLEIDSSEHIIKSYKFRMIGSWVLLFIALFLFSEGLQTYEGESTDTISECEYNEECVAANILEESLFFSFLAPDSDVEYQPGDSDDYNEVTGIFTPFVLILIGWSHFAILSFAFSKIRRVINKDKSKLKDDQWKWLEHYDKKSYRSFAGFLLSFASLYPALFTVSNNDSSLTFVGLTVLLSSIGVLYYLGLYIYLHEIRYFYHVDDEFVEYPLYGMLIVLLVGFIYGIFASPVENVSDIWLYDWIMSFDGAFIDSKSYRYVLADLILSGLATGLIAWIILYVMQENYVEDVWYLIPGLIALGAVLALGLGIYGFLAMIIIEIISMNLVWVTSFILAIFCFITMLLISENFNIRLLIDTAYKLALKRAVKVQPTAHLPPQPMAPLPPQPMAPLPPQPMAPLPPQPMAPLPTMPLGNISSQASGQVLVSKPDPSTEILSSSLAPVKPRTVTVDSKGITTIETGFSKVTLDKYTDLVTKIPQGVEQHPMFIQEIKNMNYLDEKGYDVGLIDCDEGASPKIVTRYMGPSKLSEHYKTLSVRGKKNMIEELVEHIAHIHKCGMVHRDLKPDNILVDARPRDGNHQFDAIIDYGIAMKINRRQTESYNTAGTKFFGHSSQKDPDFKASTGQDWFALARIFALLLRGVDIDSLNAEIQMSQTGLEMSSTISTLGFDESIVQSISELIVLATDPNCEDNATIGKLAKVGKALSKKL